MTFVPQPRDQLEQAFAADFLRRLHEALDEIDALEVGAVAGVLHAAQERDRCVYVMGNGGSAATAAHFVSDLLAATRGHKRLRVTSLSDNVPAFTASANDFGWASVFSDQLVGRLEAGDVVVILSASGDSENILRALDAAKEQGAVSIAFLGFGGGAALARAKHSLVVSSRDFGVVESVHASLAHLVAAIFRRRVCI